MKALPGMAKWVKILNSIPLFLSGGVFVLRGLHLVSNGVTVVLFFAILIPLATLKAFLDLRRSEDGKEDSN
jgi:hypothetical protein